jgi:hypothetical protein
LLRGEFDFLGERDGEASEGEPAKECEGEDEETSAESPAEEEHPADKLVRRWTGREPDALEEVDHLLMSANVTMDVAIQPAVFENLDMIERIEHLIEIAEARRNSALHELDQHRSTLAKVVRGTIQHIEENEPPVVAPKTIERIRSQR